MGNHAQLGREMIMVLRTKWDVLSERRDALKAQLADVESELVGMLTSELGVACAGCGLWLATEADFAQHFQVTDDRFLNVGRCPAVLALGEGL
jgi:hypothetical protein